MFFLSRYKAKEQRLIISGLFCAIILSGLIIYQEIKPAQDDAVLNDSIRFMQEMLDEIKSYCENHNIRIDPIEDPAGTGLIGPEWTEMTSTIGHLEAKRTTIQPDFAALVSQLFKEADLQKGDTIAIACSGSFPGSLLACLSAAKACGIECKTVLSLGSSSYGANRLELTILDIYNILYEKGLIDTVPLAVSLGGENDIGETWEEETILTLENSILRSGYHYIKHPALRQSVEERFRLYGLDGKNSIKAFVNVGGAMANMGLSPSILYIKPGVVRTAKIPDIEQQGMIHKALINDVPVIHLLNIKGLAREYNIKWDPVIR